MEEVIIIGSGPAACTAALYVARADMNPLMFAGDPTEGMLPGGQLMTTTEVENYPGYPDGVTGPQLMDDLQKQCQRFGARIEHKMVTKIDTSSHPFKLTVDGETVEAKAVILATGADAKYLGLESEEKYMNRGVSACATCDGALPRFRKNPVVVVGGGDTAMEEALFLAKFSSKVHIVHRRDEFRASKIMAQRAINHENIQVEWNSVVEEILGNDKDGVTGVRVKDTKTGETREIACTGYFAAIGHKPNSDLVADVVTTDELGYIVCEGDSTRTDVPGLFACGDVADKVYRQAITAAGTGCRAALDAIRWLENQEG